MTIVNLTSNLGKINTFGNKLCQSKVQNFFPILSANVVGKALRDIRNKPMPYPYKEKNFPLWKRWFDQTTARFDENTKIIVVDGPVASGKTAFAKELAEELDMHHIEDAHMDLMYINHIGYDCRQLDSQLPESVQSFDDQKFCLTPKSNNTAAYQIRMYMLRYSLYIDALAHVLSTGQGVVIERSPWSDVAFLEAIASQNYISQGAKNVYYNIKLNTIHRLLKPHLIIYLDIPVPKVMEKIKARGRPNEVNGRALTKQYLEDLEIQYKTNYLKYITEHAELLMYDWSDGGDVEVIVEDIERIDFDRYNKHDKKLRDWIKFKEQFWHDDRVKYADNKSQLMSFFNCPNFEVPELVANAEDIIIWNEVWENAPGNKYLPGYEKDSLFKTKIPKYVLV